MNKKRAKHSLIFGLIGGVIFVIYMIVSMTINFIIASRYDKINHFDKIEVCRSFDKYIVDTNMSDKYIKDLPFIDSYVHKLNFEGNEFELYAYEFESTELAKQYLYNVKKCSTEGNIFYRSSTNIFASNLIVVNNNNVYRIEAGSTEEYIKIMKFLNSVFLVEIR